MGMRFYFIVTPPQPYHLTVISSVSLDVAYLFWGRGHSSILLSIIVHQLVAILVLPRRRLACVLLLCHLEPEVSLFCSFYCWEIVQSMNIPQFVSFPYWSAFDLEKAMAPHSSTLARKIPWSEEPGKLQSMGSRGVEHDWATSLSLFTFIHWRRKWQPTPVFLPGESQGCGSLVGCCLWGRIESDTTEAT